MPSSTRLDIKHIIKSFPDINFREGSGHAWDPKNRQVTYLNKSTPETVYGLLHEIAHALLDHSSFRHDIELLKMERDAWTKAIDLAESKFSLKIDKDHAEDCLDSYRDWLYKRSLCPRCRLTGFQIDKHTYSCPHCQIDWKVPASRLCSVKRQILSS